MAKHTIDHRFTRRDLATLAGAAALTLVPGCGGGGAATSGRGALIVTIHWPASRAIPADTQSVNFRVQVLEPDEGLIVVQKVVARPTGQTLSQAVLDHVPSVKVRVMATAHRTTDGTGEVLASGTAEVRVTENGNVPVSITLGAISRVEIQPAAISVTVNQSIQLSAHAFDSQGNEVTVASTSWQWSITPGTIASIVPSGNSAQVTGLATGGAIASVVLTEAGLSASTNVTVSPFVSPINGAYQGIALLFDLLDALPVGNPVLTRLVVSSLPDGHVKVVRFFVTSTGSLLQRDTFVCTITQEGLVGTKTLSFPNDLIATIQGTISATKFSGTILFFGNGASSPADNRLVFDLPSAP
ncbi:MAG: hypothetical protein ABJA67_03470 [Chthonomonadales bacterium]